MKTIALYGIATDDQIVVLNSNYHEGSEVPVHVTYRRGGIFNVERAIRNYSQDIGVSLVYSSIDSVYVNVWKNRKQSFPKFSYTKFLHPVKASWHHIAYLDELPQFQNISTLYAIESEGDSVISVDLCGRGVTKQIIEKVAPHINYWFMSDDHPNCRDVATIASLVKNAVIIHTPKETKIIHPNGLSEGVVQSNYNDSIIDVVGAGDYFAGGFICSKLYRKSDSHACSTGHQVAKTELENQSGV